MLDCLLVGVLVALVGPLAFSLTGGRLQTAGVGVSSVSCVGTTTVPADLNPPPLDGSNHAEVCAAGAFPFAVSKRYLVVGRRTANSGRTTDVNLSYALSSSGEPIAAIDLTWLFQLGFLAYIVAGLLTRGRTLGMRLFRVRLVVPPFDAGRVGVPVSCLLIRVAVAVAGFIPGAAALAWALFVAESAQVGLFIAIAMAAWLGWVGYNVVLVALKKDPIYDRVAGVAVLIERHGSAPDAMPSTSPPQ